MASVILSTGLDLNMVLEPAADFYAKGLCATSRPTFGTSTTGKTRKHSTRIQILTTQFGKAGQTMDGNLARKEHG